MTQEPVVNGDAVQGSGPEEETAADRTGAPGRGILSPLERLTEALYGIILVLTFTGTLRVAVQKGQDVHGALRAALGCCLAWAIVDAAMYVFNRVASRNRSLKVLQDMQSDPATARQKLVEALPFVVTMALTPSDWDRIAATLRDLRLPKHVDATNEDLLGGLGIFVLANLALLPLAVPFALLSDVHEAQHVSNGVALLLLFAGGWRLARETGENPIRVGLRFLLFGIFLVAVTLALGG